MGLTRHEQTRLELQDLYLKIDKYKEDAELCQQLVKILSNHCGETGENEGAVNTLKRKLKDAEKYISMRKDDSCGSLYEGYEKYIQLKELLKKRIEQDYMDTELEIGGFVLNNIVIKELGKILDGKDGTK